MLATGGSAMMAVEVLLSRGVKINRIFLFNSLAAPEGRVSNIPRQDYPDVKIITGGIDEKLTKTNISFLVWGDFGDEILLYLIFV